MFGSIHSEFLQNVTEMLENIKTAAVEDPDVLQKLRDLNDSNPETNDIITTIETIISENRDNSAEALDSWFQSVFYNDNATDGLFHSWLNKRVVPDAQRGAIIAKGRRDQRKAQTNKRKQEWDKYAPFLDAYFGRNPQHSLTEGRRRCAQKFNCSSKTIARRTPGYKKPDL